MSRAEFFRTLVRGERRGPLAFLARAALAGASVPYRAGVGWRNWRFDGGRGIARAAVPVVSVGNLTMGGTGKTPCVEYVARLLSDDGHAVAILSRGYGAHDEALVLEENLPDVPHLQGADRVALAMTAVEELERGVLVLDDGFQHRKLYRDFDIVLVDATTPLWDERLFPRGMLREPASSLKRASVVLLTRCDVSTTAEQQRQWLRERFPALPVFRTVHEPHPLALADGPTFAFCGLGNPEGFRRTLARIGRTPAEFRTFPDHHPYTRDDVNELQRWAATLPAHGSVLTTQKDWVKLRLDSLAGRPLLPVRIGFAFQDGGADFAKLLRAAVPPSERTDADDSDLPAELDR